MIPPAGIPPAGTPATGVAPAAGQSRPDAPPAPASGVRIGPNGEHQFPCTQCGAWLRFNPAVEQLKCDHCGFVNPVPQLGPPVAEQDYNAALAATHGAHEIHTVEMLRCASCAAAFTLDPNVESGLCPFCGSAVVREITSAEQLKPKGVLPFKITTEQAGEQFRAWLKRLWFAPSKLKQYARTERGLLSGMYTPYWTFDSATRTQYTGERGDDYTVYVTREVTRDGKTTTEQVAETETRWTWVSGQVTRDFDDVLVLASASLPERITDKLEPWDLPNLKPYAEEYLSGFRSEHYQVDLESGFARARGKMDVVIRGDICRDIGGNHQRIASVNTQHDRVTYKHVLLPVWLAAYQYQNKTYRFVVNGRTGEVQGERPWSWLKIAGAVAAVIAVGVMVYLLTHATGSGAPALPK